MKISAHFDSKEFECRDGSKSPYPHVVQTALLNWLEAVRAEFGKPLYVNSGYRSPSWNEKVGGVKNSFHCKGLAADVRPADQDDLPRLQEIALRVVHHGGVGLYDTFVHIDGRGYKARWDNRTKKAR